ncbi:ead/Ea22-like family protein [Klebsiella pneumoniae]|nr:ead/Ea22-like family protein [Klebsiella pneumoniae]
MTDITELAQSLKAAAEKAIGAHERLAAYPYDEIIDISQQEGEQIDIDIADINEFLEEASPANVLALVEALEKAQRANAAQDDHINQQQDRIDQLEKGHQEAAKQINSWRRMAKQNIAEREKDIAELDADRQRIAELESRTVKLPKLKMLEDYLAEVAIEERKQILVGVKLEFHRACVAAGIKVEAE